MSGRAKHERVKGCNLWVCCVYNPVYFHSVATNAEVETMELQVRVAHGLNGAFALEEPIEVGPNVRLSSMRWTGR